MQTATKIKTGDLLETELKPLTRKKTNGETQTRFSNVENSIREILELDWKELVDRSKIAVDEDPQFVQTDKTAELKDLSNNPL